MNNPLHAPIIYRDFQSLFLEWEGMVLKFDFTEGGLTKALKHVPLVPTKLGLVTGNSNFTAPPSLKGHIARKTKPADPVKVAKSTLRSRAEAKISPEQRAAARDLIRRKLG